MKIIVFDVGNAACSLITCPNKYGLMIDCGSHGDKKNPIDVIKAEQSWLGIKPFVKSTGDKFPLGLLHITHPDDDHVRNAKRVREELTPFLLKKNNHEKFPKEESINQEYIDHLDKDYRNEITEEVKWGFDVNKTFQIPISTIISDETLKGKIKNNSSILRFVEYQGVKILYCGDIETEGWEWLLNNNPDFIESIENGVDILISSHHGHKSGYSKSLFDKIGDVKVVIHSKGSEGNIEGTDVSSQYTENATGVKYQNLGDKELYFGSVLTTRSNGNVYLHCKDGQFSVWADKASSKHNKLA